MLHAQGIAFQLPTGEEVKIGTSIPESFKEVIESARKSYPFAQNCIIDSEIANEVG